MNSLKERGSRAPGTFQNPQSFLTFLLSKPVLLGARFFTYTILSHFWGEELQGNLICNPSWTKPVWRSSLRLQTAGLGLLLRPQTLSGSPAALRSPPPPLEEKRGEGPENFHTATPTDHHSLVPPGHAESERFRRAPLGRDWGCSSAPDSCHHCSRD